MERVRFCKNCGELLEDHWLHCPWCGQETARGGGSANWGSIVDDSLDRAESRQQKGNIGLLEDLSGRLDALESELDAFLSTRR